MYIADENLNPIDNETPADHKIGVIIEGEIARLHQALTIGFAVYASTGELAFWSLQTDVEKDKWPELKVGKNKIAGWIPKHFLNEGDYRIELILSLHYIEWISQPGINAPYIHLHIRGGLSKSPYWMMVRPGVNAPILNFEMLK
jgi:lipopolysaccharide transport system ATP-binding protein